MAKCREESIIPSSGFNTNIIYHAGKRHYSENYYRALCAIYLGLLGDGMSQFTFAIDGGPKTCPWEIPGREYISSCQLREERERDDDAEMVDESSGAATPHRVKRRRPETNDGEQ